MLKPKTDSSKASHQVPQQVVCRGVSRGTRRGYAIIEMIVTASLLSAAMLGVAQLARVHSVIRVQADVRLSAELVADNIIERLRGVDLDKLDERREAIEADSSGLRVIIDSFPVDADEVRGAHLIIRVFADDGGDKFEPLVTSHHWVLEPQKPQNVSVGKEETP